MIIELKKFGTTLTSRQSGREAYNAFAPVLRELTPNEPIYLDFSGVLTLSPSWADEFVTSLIRDFPDRVILKKTNNISVIETIKMLEEINHYSVKKA